MPTDRPDDDLLISILRQDRVVILVAIAAITALAWVYILWLAAEMEIGGMSGAAMSGMERPDLRMPGVAPPAEVGAHNIEPMFAPTFAPWSPGYAFLMLIMWAVMMVGMMTPSAAPMILLYARVGRQAERAGKPFASTACFVSGYLATWLTFAVGATAAQWALERAALLASDTASMASPLLGGFVLVLAGLYQWTALKERCLSHCQSPLVFIQRYGGFRREPRGAFLLGARHGAYCVGCCWTVMALLFVFGVMNIIWIAAIAAFVLLEKLLPMGRLIPRVAGTALIGLGIWMLA